MSGEPTSPENPDKFRDADSVLREVSNQEDDALSQASDLAQEEAGPFANAGGIPGNKNGNDAMKMITRQEGSMGGGNPRNAQRIGRSRK